MSAFGFEVIPAIDLLGGRCVRLAQGDYAAATVYADDPGAVAARFATHPIPVLHVVDLDGARSGRQANRAIVTAIAEVPGFEVQLGGGIRTAGNLAGWLEAGVSRCVVGSIAASDPGRVREWLREFGPERIVAALDVRIGSDGTPGLAIHGWTETTDTSLWACVEQYLDAGLEHVLCTDIGRDGAMRGPNLDLYREFVARYPGIRLQASGGVRNVGDLAELRDCGAASAITGRALLDGRITKEEIHAFLQGE